MARILNFTAVPAHLPESVIQICQQALWDVGNGIGIAEISHRSAFFDDLMTDLEAQFRRVGAVPDSHAVLFLQGGATLQFCTIPATFTRPGGHIDCIHTGYWTRNAMRDADFYTRIHYA
ncbi:MAG: aminotransferase class V-fold PLP-dependent enzyme, partial [Bradymonadales bacterium]|nr:aminotransferase class V-fold PLP-dependent enzyme [Bradymonadales bacterium]